MANISIKAKTFLNQVPLKDKLSAFPLTNFDAGRLETFQNDLQVFAGVKMSDIAFLTKNLDTINLFRGCKNGCLHCPHNAMAPAYGRETILYRDLKNLVQGFKTLSERLGFDVLNGNKALHITEDANPLGIPIIGEKKDFTVLDAMNLIYDKLHIPFIFKTSVVDAKGSKEYKRTNLTIKHLINRAQKTPDEFKDIQISITPFLKLANYPDKAAEMIYAFLDLFKMEKARIVLRYAQEQYVDFNRAAAVRLYNLIFSKLQKLAHSNLESVPLLSPEIVTRPAHNSLISPLGRGKNFTSPSVKKTVMNDIKLDTARLNALSPDEQRQFLSDNSRKRIDIDGSVYTSRSIMTNITNTPLEIITPTEIKLNFVNKKKPNKLFIETEVSNPLK